VPERQQCNENRFGAPGITSVIFAPPQQNYSLSLVTMRVPLLDALALECLSGLDESTTEAKIVENWLRDTRERGTKTPDYLTEYFQDAMSTSSVTLTLHRGAASNEPSPIATRHFPFVSHYDLLTAPTEGTFFDPDDFVDR
jgi:hypothetical protein